MADVRYSLDMVRLQVEVFDDEWFTFYKNVLADSIFCNFYVRSRLQEYAYNYVIHESYDSGIPTNFYDNTVFSQNKFWIGFTHNTEKQTKQSHNLVVEYNPNKCDIGVGILNRLLRSFFTNNNFVKLKSLDVAIDLFDVPMSNVIYDKGLKHSVRDFKTSKGRTLYFGERGSNGSTKVYDKGKEQKLEKDWVRYESTIKLDIILASLRILKDLEVELPCIHIRNNVNCNCKDAKLRSAVLCIENDLMSINDFAYDFRKKIKTYLADTSYIKIDNSVKPKMVECIITYFKLYCKQFNVKWGIQ